MSFRLDRRRFRNWLKAHDPDEEVGYTRVSHQCPIARHLKDIGVVSPYVFSFQVEWMEPSEDGWLDFSHRDLPKDHWVAQYVQLVDVIEGPITASEALDYLDAIETPVAVMDALETKL